MSSRLSKTALYKLLVIKLQTNSSEISVSAVMTHMSYKFLLEYMRYHTIPSHCCFWFSTEGIKILSIIFDGKKYLKNITRQILQPLKF